MHVYSLQCFCNDRGPHLAHGRISLDHVHVELCHQNNDPDRKTIVVVTDKIWAIMKGDFSSITKLYKLQDASDLDDDRLHWFKSKIEFVQWLDCHDPGASVGEHSVQITVPPPFKRPIMPCAVLNADLGKGRLIVHSWLS